MSSIKGEDAFTAEQANQKWGGATYSTYLLFLKNGEVRYNCSILDLYEFCTEEAFYQTVQEFAFAMYNQVRPHSFNEYQKLQKRLTTPNHLVLPTENQTEACFSQQYSTAESTISGYIKVTKNGQCQSTLGSGLW